MNNSLRIHDCRHISNDDYNELSANVDGDRIFFRVPPQVDLPFRGEPFIGAALLEAMVRGVNIKVDKSLPVSMKLYSRLPEIQSIYKTWNENLQKIVIEARTESIGESYENVACFWSAGVDSSHTLFRNIEQVTHLVLLGGFEAGGNTEEAWNQCVEKQSAFCLSIGKKLIPMATNAKQWAEKRKLSWDFAQGLVLASMSPLFKCKEVLIGASHTFDNLFPAGTHPLTDPMWSTESTELIHYGAIRRSQKVFEISKNDLIFNNLQVCWRSPVTNCGECSKCVRTMVIMFLLNLSNKTFPQLDSFDKLKIFKNNNNESGMAFMEDLMILSKEVQNNKVRKILRGYYRTFKISVIISMIDRYLLGGAIRRSYQRVRKPSWFKFRIVTKGPKAWDLTSDKANIIGTKKL